MHKFTILCSLALSTTTENMKKKSWFTAKVFNNHEKYTVTNIFSILFSGYSICEATCVQVPGGEVEVRCEKQTQSMSASHCPFTDFHLTSSQVNVSLTSFLQASPVVWSCVAVLISSPLKENKKNKRQQWTAWRMPCSCLRLYTKQHAHEI